MPLMLSKVGAGSGEECEGGKLVLLESRGEPPGELIAPKDMDGFG